MTTTPTRATLRRIEIDLSSVPPSDIASMLGALLDVIFPLPAREIMQKVEWLFFYEIKTRVERRSSVPHELDLTVCTIAELIFLAMFLRASLGTFAKPAHLELHRVMAKIIESVESAIGTTHRHDGMEVQF